MANTQYSDNYKKRMDRLFRIKETDKQKTSIINNTPKIQIPKEVKKIIEEKLIRKEIVNFNKIKKNSFETIIISIVLTILLVLIYFLSYKYKSYLSYAIILILITTAIILFLIHKRYEKWVIKANKALILSLVYTILIVNIILGIKIYSIEWAFLGFIFSAVIFYDSRIDSRFLIFPALLLLGYIPFLLIGKQNTLAETFAVYVYYFLVVGVGLQVAEFLGKYENSVDFEKFIIELIEKINWISIISIIGIITLAIIIANRFYDLEIWKWTSVYFFAVCLVFYMVHYLKGK